MKYQEDGVQDTVYMQWNPQIHVYTNEIENVFLINNDNFW